MKSQTIMKHPASASPVLRLSALLLAAISCSCIQPPPPRVHRPEVSRQLDRLAYDAPVTPLPSPGAWVWEGY